MPRALFPALLALVCATAHAAQPTLDGKVLFGYQGWFRCPGGTNGTNWFHWSNGAPTPATLVTDMYPDLREFESDELCPVPGMTIGDRPAHFFSSLNAKTVDRHFAWMRQYGLDGVLIQRFLSDFSRYRAENDLVLRNILAAARRHGRVIAIEYDISGANPATVVADLQNDWNSLKRAYDITAHPGYLHHDGKPVLGVWGIGLGEGRHPPADPAVALELINWFKTQAKVAYMGGTPAYWRTLTNDSVRDEAWTGVYRAMDVIQPWTVGRYNSVAAADRWRTNQIAPDLAATQANGQLYMPVIFPGFSWHNLNRTAAQNQIPRLRGEFLWRQAVNARAAGARTLKIAMFDEVNESTAMFKLAARRADAPDQGYWLTLDADGGTLPSDWYLRLAAEITRAFRNGTALPATLPTRPGPPWADDAKPVAANAASFTRDTLAPDSIAVLAGSGLPSPADSEPATVTVLDSTGAGRPASVFFSGPTQWNVTLPAPLAAGPATLVLDTGALLAYATAEIAPVSPGLFTAASDGQGAPAALLHTTRPDGGVTVTPAFQCSAPGVCVPVPITPGPSAVLELYGTGIRGRTTLDAVACRIADLPVTVLYAGPQASAPGLDQVNVTLPAALAGRGRATLQLSIDGVPANPVTLEFR